MAMYPTDSDGLLHARADVFFEDITQFAKKSDAETLCLFFVRDGILQATLVDKRSMCAQQIKMLASALRDTANDLEKP